ncbi:hypothetical protein HELRODRAFT_76777, partial [Helobdella robusta]|uniref:Phosphodiesterase n=1 Tax=Helobdella robusta TaxID=6412 RepID=T1G2P4_HELRO
MVHVVTPFAQIVHSLRSVRNNFLSLTKSTSVLNKFEMRLINLSHDFSFVQDQLDKLSSETLGELEWCLEQLEIIQTHRSVSEMATNKFKRMLNRELSHFAESSKAGNQISEYISSTFLGEFAAWNNNNNSNSERKSPMLEITGVKRPSITPPASSIIMHPKYGVDSNDPEHLDEIMADIDKWGIDIFEIGQLTNNRPMTTVTYTILAKRDLLRAFNICSTTMLNYLMTAEDHYRPEVPYHNGYHAADVTQSCHVLLSLPALENLFTDLEILATIFASCIHDIDHPGFTNNYFITTGSDLALMYNDESVLENHHLAVAFKLLQQTDCDFLASLPTKSRQILRRIVISLVLATDMNKHMDHVAHLKTMVEARKLSGADILSQENYSDRLLILQHMIHCADLSNPTKPLPLYKKWTDAIMEEFFRQGDAERERELDISPMCDRLTATVEKSQVGFIDYIVHPLWDTWAELVEPGCREIIESLEYNRDWYYNAVP